MHSKRLFIALVLLPVLYVYIMYLPEGFGLFLIVAVSTIALAEFYAMFRIDAFLKYAGLICGIFLLIMVSMEKGFVDALLFSVLLIMGLRLMIIRDSRSSRMDIGTAVLGLLYIPGTLLFQIRLLKVAPQWIIMLYVTVWMADSMAYYIGTRIGRKKLYEAVSPNKTVAGAAGSVAGGIVGGVFLKMTLLPQIQLYESVLIGSAVGGITIIGDLVESMFKRDAGVKDSSSLVPGHGGILDKIDGVTFAGPVLYWLCRGLGLII